MKLKKHRIVFDGKYYRCQEWKLWTPRWKYIGGLFHPVERKYRTLDAARDDLESYLGLSIKCVFEY